MSSPIAWCGRAPMASPCFSLANVGRDFSAFRQAPASLAGPIEPLLDHICKQEVQRADSNALFLQHINCIASCHTERPFSTKASASAARMCRVAVVCDKQSTQGECLLTFFLSLPSASRSSDWYSCCCTPSIDSWHICSRADLEVDLVLWSSMLS
jgi:hypothetical protein